MEFLFFLLVIFVFFAFSAWRGYVRAGQVNMLMDHGLPTQARITRKVVLRRGANRYRLIYEYESPTRTHRHASFVSRERYEATEVGQFLPVRYLPERPDVAAPEFVIDEMREARRRLAEKTARGQ